MLIKILSVIALLIISVWAIYIISKAFFEEGIARKIGKRMTMLIPMFDNAEDTEEILRAAIGLRSFIEGEFDILVVDYGMTGDSLKIAQIFVRERNGIFLIDKDDLNTYFHKND